MVNRFVRYALFAVIVVLLTVTAFLLWRPGFATEASAPTISSAAPTDSFICTPVAVATWPQRVHVRCNPAAGAIGYFAVCTAPDSANASRFLSVFTTAKATGKNVAIYYTLSDNTSGAACGCNAGDCRLAYGAEVQQ